MPDDPNHNRNNTIILVIVLTVGIALTYSVHNHEQRQYVPSPTAEDARLTSEQRESLRNMLRSGEPYAE